MGINLTEGLLIAAIVTFFFGGKKIPELGKTLGQSMKSFKAGMKGDQPEEKKPVETKLS
jgi:sec-independent protein translocase protein TatA